MPLLAGELHGSAGFAFPCAGCHAARQLVQHGIQPLWAWRRAATWPPLWEGLPISDLLPGGKIRKALWLSFWGLDMRAGCLHSCWVGGISRGAAQDAGLPCVLQDVQAAVRALSYVISCR